VTTITLALDLIGSRAPASRASRHVEPSALADALEITAKLAAPPHFEASVRYTSPSSAAFTS